MVSRMEAPFSHIQIYEGNLRRSLLESGQIGHYFADRRMEKQACTQYSSLSSVLDHFRANSPEFPFALCGIVLAASLARI